MLFENLINRGALPVLQQVMSFTEARQVVLANNVSNLDTVDFKMQDLPADEFFSALDKAIKNRSGRGAGAELEMKNTKNLNWDSQNRLKAGKVDVADSNILFHDNNNRFVEKQMTQMSKNAMLHNIATELLRGQYGKLSMAISGKI